MQKGATLGAKHIFLCCFVREVYRMAILMVRITPSLDYEDLPCSMVAISCAKCELIEEKTSHANGYMTLNDNNAFIRKHLTIVKYKYYRRNERIKLKDLHIKGKAIVLVLGHYIYLKNETYWSFFDNEDDEVVAYWLLPDNDKKVHRVSFICNSDVEISDSSYFENIIFEIMGEGYTTFLSPLRNDYEILAAESVLALKKAFPELKLICVLPKSLTESDSDKQNTGKIINHSDFKTDLDITEHLECNKWLIDHSNKIVVSWSDKNDNDSTVSYAVEQSVYVNFIT